MMPTDYERTEQGDDPSSTVAELAKIIKDLELAVAQLLPHEDREQWAYRRGARDAYIKVLEELRKL